MLYCTYLALHTAIPFSLSRAEHQQVLEEFKDGFPKFAGKQLTQMHFLIKGGAIDSFQVMKPFSAPPYSH